MLIPACPESGWCNARRLVLCLVEEFGVSCQALVQALDLEGTGAGDPGRGHAGAPASTGLHRIHCNGVVRNVWSTVLAWRVRHPLLPGPGCLTLGGAHAPNCAPASRGAELGANLRLASMFSAAVLQCSKQAVTGGGWHGHPKP